MLCEWGHERGSLFPFSGLKGKVTLCEIRGPSLFWPCYSVCGHAHLKMTENTVFWPVSWEKKVRMQILSLKEYILFVFHHLPPPSRGEFIFMEAHLYFAQTFGFEQLIYLWQKAILPEKLPPTPMLIFWRAATGLQFYQEFHQQV